MEVLTNLNKNNENMYDIVIEVSNSPSNRPHALVCNKLTELFRYSITQ